jgi:hypothetical protein
LKSARKYGAAVVAALLLGSAIHANVAQSSQVISENIPFLGLDLRENAELGRIPSVFIAKTDPNNENTWLICDGIDDKLCTDAPGIHGFSNWDICTDASTVACIANVWAVDSTGKKIQGEFLERVPVDPKYDVKENAQIGLPESNGVGALWRIPGVLNSGNKDTYFIAAQSVFGVNKAAGTSISTSKVNLYELTAGIVPVQEITGTFLLLRATDARENLKGAWGTNGTRVASDGTSCMATELTFCQAARQFPTGYRFGLTLRVGAKPKGWYHGRLSLPTISTKDWKSGQEISIEAEPVKVPSLDFYVPISEVPDAVKKIVFSGPVGGKGLPNGGIQVTENLSGPNTLKLVSLFAAAYKDKATTTDTYWSFKTLNEGNDQSTRQCSDNSGNLAGLVTTNALAYAAGPPVFDKSTGSLTYKVASPHFEASGVEASGSYDLVLKSDVARCIYGFSNAPIQAEISITSTDGEKKVATTVVNEKSGWLYLSAKGFTFSSPVINVKLSQEKEVVVPTPAASAIPPVIAKPAAKKSTTITCLKGKMIKKVSGTNPKCPTGFKKK